MTNDVDDPGLHKTKAVGHRTGYGGNRDIALNHHQRDNTAGVVEITDASTGLENVNAGFIIPNEVSLYQRK